MRQSVASDAVRVAVHSSDGLTRAGLLSYLVHDRRLLPAEAVREADVTVVAAEVANASTLGLLRRLAEEGDEKRDGMNFVMVIGRRWEADVWSAVNRGVRAVLPRGSFTADEFTRTLIAVAQGGASLPASLQGALVEQLRLIQRDVLTPHGISANGVTTREVDVLRLLAEGWELAEIADKLSYSERTVKYVLYGLTKRLGLRNRAHAVSYAIRSGLI